MTENRGNMGTTENYTTTALYTLVNTVNIFFLFLIVFSRISKKDIKSPEKA